MRSTSWSIKQHPYLALAVTFVAGAWLARRWSRRGDAHLTPSVRQVDDLPSAPEYPLDAPERVDPYLSIRAPEQSSPGEALRGNDSDAPTFGSEGGGGVPTVT